jgi:hypothetical protein
MAVHSSAIWQYVCTVMLLLHVVLVGIDRLAGHGSTTTTVS